MISTRISTLLISLFIAIPAWAADDLRQSLLAQGPNDGNDDVTITIPSSSTKKKEIKNFMKKTVLGMLAIAAATQIAGIGIDIATMVEIDNSRVMEPRMALDPQQIQYNYDPSICDVQTIECSSAEEERFLQMCNEFNARNATRGIGKRIGGGEGRGGGGNSIAPRYRMKNIPKNCTEACDSVANGQECTINTIENGQIAIQECNKYSKMSALFWNSLGSVMCGGVTSVFLISGALITCINLQDKGEL